jgi:ferrous iron transport protein B
MEVPSWQLPKPLPFLKKLYRRAKDYVTEAAPLILVGMLIITIAEMAGVIEFVTNILKYPLSTMMGLPADTAPVVLLGFLRKDVSIALLVPYALTAKQLVIACVFMAMYLPCVGSFFVLLKESGWKDISMIIATTLSVSLLTGTALNFIM